MKIEDKRELKTLGSLENGEVFTDKLGRKLMKTDIFAKNNFDIVCVYLDDGRHAEFTCKKIVTPLNAKVVIE